MKKIQLFLILFFITQSLFSFGQLEETFSLRAFVASIEERGDKMNLRLYADNGSQIWNVTTSQRFIDRFEIELGKEYYFFLETINGVVKTRGLYIEDELILFDN